MVDINLLVDIVYDYIVLGKSVDDLDIIYDLKSGTAFKYLSDLHLHSDLNLLCGKYSNKIINDITVDKELLYFFLQERYKKESLEDYILRKKNSNSKIKFKIDNVFYRSIMLVLLLLIILLTLYIFLLFGLDFDDIRKSNKPLYKFVTEQLDDSNYQSETMIHNERILYSDEELIYELGEDEDDYLEPHLFEYLGYKFMGRSVGTIPVGEVIGIRDKEIIVGNYVSGQLTGNGFHYTKNMSRMGYYESGQLITGAQLENYGNKCFLSKVSYGKPCEYRILIIKNSNPENQRYIAVNANGEEVAVYKDNAWYCLDGEPISEDLIELNAYYIENNKYYLGSDDFYYENGSFVKCGTDLIMELSVDGDDFYYNSLVEYNKYLESNDIENARDITGVTFSLGDNKNLVKCNYLTEDIEYLRDFNIH